MKKIILSLVIAAGFVACSGKKTTVETATNPTVMVADTNGLSQFKQWKENQDLAKSQDVISEDQAFSTSPVAETIEPAATVRSKPETRVVYRNVPAVRERKVERVYAPAPRAPETGVRTSRSRNTTTENTEANRPETDVAGSGNGTDVSNGDVATTTPAEVEKPKNEGWSKAAKGTAIGAGSGAVLGAILSKNKGKGAVIGGVVGAAGGYIFGRKQDKKDGRTNYN